MEWTYTLNDAVQLVIPWACLLLLTGAGLAYITLYFQIRQPLYLSGLLICISTLLYVGFEALVVLAGWAGWSKGGPQFHRLGQLASVWFPTTLMFFAWTFLEKDNLLKKAVKWLGWLALVLAAFFTLAAYIIPDSFISGAVDLERTILSPGDFFRGVTGPLYTLRDLFMGSFMLIFTALAVHKMIISKKEMNVYFIVIGLAFIFWGSADDMIFYQTGHNFFLNSFRFSRVSVGITFMVFFFLTSLLVDFLRAQRELKVSYDLIHKSEEKYRLLSEGADQAIFSMTENLKIKTFNNKASQLFQLGKNKSLGIVKLLRMHQPESSHVVEEMLEEKIEELLKDKYTSFRTALKDPRTGEPEEYEFQFKGICGESSEYIGWASKLQHNRFSNYVEYEKLKLSIDNYIVVIDDVSTRLTHALHRYMDPGTAMQIKMGLQEMIINAIEHGNLGITFEEKSQVLQQGDYREFLKERQAQSPYKERSVSIEYVLCTDTVQYLIADEGEGFDFHHTLDKVAKKVDQEMLPHGRGIRMSQIIFDKVKYNKKGNQVLLVKQLTPEVALDAEPLGV